VKTDPASGFVEIASLQIHFEDTEAGDTRRLGQARHYSPPLEKFPG
jgi:hypothetical protein